MTRKIATTVAATLMLLLLAMSMVGCGAATQATTPSDTVSKAFDALKAQDCETLTKYYNGDTAALENPEAALSGTDLSQLGIDQTQTELTDEQKAVADAVTKKLLDFDYSTSNEKIDGDKATVDVSVTTYDFGGMFTSFFTEYISQAFASAFTDGADEAALQEQAFTLLNSKIGELSAKDKTNTATITLTKAEDGTWKIDELRDNKEFADALLGGAISSLSGYLDSFSSLMGSSESADAA